MAPNKKDRYYNELITYLNENKYVENSTEKYTHLSYGKLTGKYYISKDNIKDFMKLYINAVNHDIEDLSILEIQPDYGPIIVDIDLKYPIEENNNERLYDDELIMNIVEKFKNSIIKYLEITDINNFLIFVFEKKQKSETDDYYKDGFHIIFNEVIASAPTRHLIRHEVVKICKEEKLFDKYIENTDKIIDKAVVSSNGWFLPYSKKPSGYCYYLTKLYNYNLELLTDNEDNNLSKEEIIKSCSLHYNHKKYKKKNANKLLNTENINIKEEIPDINIQNKNLLEILNEDKQRLINRAYKFSTLLNSSRAESFEEWRNVGLALHSTDESLLYAWIEFSKKCPSKFSKTEQGGCPKVWKTFKIPCNKSLLTIRSLAYWAKLDNPKDYEQYINEEFKLIINKCSYTTFEIASAFVIIYPSRYAYSPKSNIWREFKPNIHRWVEISHYCISKVLSEEFSNYYYKEAQVLNTHILKLEGDKRASAEEKYKSLNKIADRLNDITFKKNIIEELKSLYLDEKFEEKLDSNEYLFGFENGVYDIKQKSLRNGMPEDFISFSTRNDYIPYSENRPYIKKIFEFLEQVLRNDKVRKYKLLIFAACICGLRKDEKFLIDYGEGSNGKSLLLSDLLSYAFGDYYMSVPINMFTRKRGASNDASPDKVRIKGRRIGILQETDDGDKLNVGVLKELTGGDKILVRDLYKGSSEMLDFKPQMQFILACNQLPEVPSIDDGTWRRITVINFDSKFVNNPMKTNEFKINTNLKQEVKSWGADFISYLIYLYENEYSKLNFIETPNEVLMSTNLYKNQNDYYTDYINNNLKITDNQNDVIYKTDLIKHFKAWYSEDYENGKKLNKADVEKLLILSLKNKYPQYENCKMTFRKIIICPKEEKTNNLDDF
jgi:P4 family phage/plasmid primase-like protien